MRLYRIENLHVGFIIFLPAGQKYKDVSDIFIFCRFNLDLRHDAKLSFCAYHQVGSALKTRVRSVFKDFIVFEIGLVGI